MSEDSVKTDGAIEQHTRLTHLSEHLANERTYLAYLRTSISLMSFGIAINRFSLYLMQSREAPRSSGIAESLIGSEQLGVGMVILGMVLLVWAAVRYGQVLRHINARDFQPRPRSIWIMTALVLIGGLTGALWLVLS